MRIVIDMLGAQGGSLQRGIGRYTLALSKAVARAAAEHEVMLVLNGLIPDAIPLIRQAFEKILPQENILVWRMPGPVNFLSDTNVARRQAAELTREAFLASLLPDIVLVTSLFEGLSDEAVTSIGKFCKLPTAVILYDLIPLIQRDVYLKDPLVANWYEEKIMQMRKADLLLAISESSRQEGIHHLGFADSGCINISTAADEHFRPQSVSSGDEAVIRGRYGLGRPFLMYTGGIDHRKNIEGLIQAYGAMPLHLRAMHQLAIVCSIQPATREHLQQVAANAGLAPDELVLTGFVPEEDLLSLYNLCKAFIFPSWHEGFGLPALEAMSCGKAVIAANTSSLPEVIGNPEALFDPRSEASMSTMMARVLDDEQFRTSLEIHGLRQATLFSWDSSARQAIAAMETWHVKNTSELSGKESVIVPMPLQAGRPKLAYVSPLPPERSGISDYSAELLPELAAFYDIEVIVEQERVDDPWVEKNCILRNAAWLRANAGTYDRVLYHFGNSHFHQHMFQLLEDVPGVVVLHDFFLSGISGYMEGNGFAPGFWGRALYDSHGYPAFRERFQSQDYASVVRRYPCNVGVLRRSLGVIVHSENSLRLADQWYGEGASKQWQIVPLLRVPAALGDRVQSRAVARRTLGIGEQDFVICSFGMLAPTKLNHRLLSAFQRSLLAKKQNCKLIFVGESGTDEYSTNLARQIQDCGQPHNIQVTGWTDMSTFRLYLAAADVGVQLRTDSRGETSAAVLDCMNYGLPTVVNANGSMADLPDEAVWKLPDDFADEELSAALDVLWRDSTRRIQLGERASEIVRTRHAPAECAVGYVDALERCYRERQSGIVGLIDALTLLNWPGSSTGTWGAVAAGIAQSIKPSYVKKQLLVDVTELANLPAGTKPNQAISVVLMSLLERQLDAVRIEPVRLDSNGRFRYARSYTARQMKCPEDILEDEVVDYRCGDAWLGLAPKINRLASLRLNLEDMHNVGVKISMFITVFPKLANSSRQDLGTNDDILGWLELASEQQEVFCASENVAQQFNQWIALDGRISRCKTRVGWD